MEPVVESLTEQYLADLDDLEGGESDDNNDQQRGGDDVDMDDLSSDGDEEFDEEAAAERAGGAGFISDQPSIFSMEKFRALMLKVEDGLARGAEGHVAADYDVVVQCNSFLGELDNEILAVSKTLKDLYATRLPELESLILNPLDYARVVKRIGDHIDLTDVDLNGLLPSATIMVVSVTASTTSGKPLSPEALQKVLKTCDQILELDGAKKKMLQFIEGRMSVIAPNLSMLVPASVAAQLMVQAGGMTPLSRMPACNVQMLGSSRRNLNGMSLASTNHRAGFLYAADLVSRAPADLKKKVVKLVAAKVTLVARVDATNEDPTGQVGRHFRAVVEKQIEKLQEPPPAKTAKALAAPDDKPRKRRGGVRVRKMKDRLRLSESQRAANRMQFGVAEDEVMLGTSVKGLGMLSKTQQSGKLRIAPKENNKIKLSEKAKQRRGLTAASSGATGGISSTVAMTGSTGMIFEEMTTDGTGTVTPVRLMATKKDNFKYFGGGTLQDLKK